MWLCSIPCLRYHGPADTGALLVLEVDRFLRLVLPAVDLDHLPSDPEDVDDDDSEGEHAEDLAKTWTSLDVVRMDGGGDLGGVLLLLQPSLTGDMGDDRKTARSLTLGPRPGRRRWRGGARGGSDRSPSWCGVQGAECWCSFKPWCWCCTGGWDWSLGPGAPSQRRQEAG